MGEMKPIDSNADYPSATDVVDDEMEGMLYSRHAEIQSWKDLEAQRGTPIPALFSQFYKFIQNPSTVSVETFKRMIDTDDTVGSGVDFLTTCLQARLGRYTHKSPEITEWVNTALDKIVGGFGNAVKEVLSASWAGFSVAEKVWENNDHGFIVKKIVSLPPGTLLFETMRTGELTPDGILQYQRNYNPANLAFGSGSLFGFSNGATTGSLRNDPYAKFGDFPFPIRTANTYSYLSIRIPTQKCIHYAFDAQGKFGNPYGRSLLRRGYKWYVMKDAFLQMLSVALDRKGTPLTIVYADPNTTLLDQNNHRVAQGVNSKGIKAGIRADQAAAEAFRNIHNDSTIILPGKKGQIFDTDFVPQASNASDFIAAIGLCDKSLLRSLLLPSLIFGNGDGTGSFALGQEHAKTFDKICDGVLDGTREVLLQQLIKDLISYNFPKSAWQKDGIGNFTKNELSIDEINKEMEVIEKGINTGAIDMNDLNDLNKVRDKIGFEPRDEIIERPDVGGFGDDGNVDGEGNGDGGDPANDANGGVSKGAKAVGGGGDKRSSKDA